jgi:hypothetical protein
VTVYADNLSVNDESGTTRRVLLEGDTVTVSYDDLEDLPDLATVATSGSYNDLTDKPPLEWSDISGKPGWVRPTQHTVNLSDFNNDLGEELPGTISWGNVSNKPVFFSGVYTDLTGKPNLFSGSYNDLSDKPDVSWEALRTGDPKTPAASMSGGSILVDGSMNPSNSQSLGSALAQWGSIHGLGVYAGEVDANTLYTGVALFKHPATTGFLVLAPLPDLTALEISAHFLPGANELHDLGSENQRWDKVHAKDGYFDNLEVADDIDLYNDIRFKNSDGDTVARLKYNDDGVEVDGHMFPDGDAEFVMGTIANRWKEIHARDVKFSAIVTDSIATDSVTTESIVTETISGPSFYVGPEFISVNGKHIKSVGLPEIGSDATNKSYVDQAFLDNPIPWGLITGDNKPSINYEFEQDGDVDRANISSASIVPLIDANSSLGSEQKRWDNVFGQFGQFTGLYSDAIETEMLYVNNTLSMNGNRITQIGAPESGTDAVNKSYVDSQIASPSNAWDAVTDKPEWLGKFSLSNVGPYMAPVETENFDVVATESVTPATDYELNLGQEELRWKTVYGGYGSFKFGIVFGSLGDDVKIENLYGHLHTEQLKLEREPTEDDEVATKKYVDDAVSTLSTEMLTVVAGITSRDRIVSQIVAEMAKEEIPFRLNYEVGFTTTCTIRQTRNLYFDFPISLKEHVDLISKVSLVYTCRTASGVQFLKGSSTTSISLNLIGSTTLIVTETTYAFSTANTGHGGTPVVKVSLQATIPTQVYTIASVAVNLSTLLSQQVVTSM